MPRKAVLGLVLGLILACGERDRLVFEEVPEDEIGPITRIDPPSTDTTITEGDVFVVGARAVDTSGVDSVFIQVTGANLSYLPLDAGGRDTLNFALTLPTIGLNGRTVVIGIFAVDVIGNIGSTVSRRITIN